VDAAFITLGPAFGTFKGEQVAVLHDDSIDDLCGFYQPSLADHELCIPSFNGTQQFPNYTPIYDAYGNVLKLVAKFYQPTLGLAQSCDFVLPGTVVPSSGQSLEKLQYTYLELKRVSDQLENPPEQGSHGYVNQTCPLGIFFPGVVPDSSSNTIAVGTFSALGESWFQTAGAVDAVFETRLLLLKRLLSALLKRFVDGLLRQIFRHIHTVKRSFYRPVPVFCGHGWSRRLWFLLHGAHPPRLTLLPA
jgi:hypothetical protein